MQRSICLWAWALVTVMLYCTPAALANPASLSLHAAQLGPTLALLTWSAPTPAAVLSLSSGQHSSTRFSLTEESLSHLIVIGVQSDDANQATQSFSLCERFSNQPNASASSPCAHAALPAPSSAVSMDGSAASPWHLSGARLSARPTVSPDSSSSHRFSWTASPVSASPSAPPLLYSLFAEWTAPTVDASELSAAQPTSQATIQPTLQRHAIRMCSAQSHSHDQRTELHCDIDQHRLPTGVEITMHLITECDYQRIDAQAGASLPHCLTAVSPELRVTLDPLMSAQPVPAVVSPIFFAADSASSVIGFEATSPLSAFPGVHQLANDTAVRIALCNFYTLTSGQATEDCQVFPVPHGWCNSAGWCNRNVSVCNWAGIACDAGMQTIERLELACNGLSTGPPMDPADLFVVLPDLRTLDLSKNSLFVLSALNLTHLTALQSVTLAELPAPARVIPLTLPSPCGVTQLTLIDSLFQPSSLEGCVNMTALVLDNLSPAASIPFAVIAYMPQLEMFQAPQVTITSEAVGSYGGGLTGGPLVQFILYNLGQTNPVLIELDLSGSTIEFGDGADNFPHIRSPVMSLLRLEELSQLRTGPLGPSDLHFLADMPGLTEFSAIGLSGVVINTAAFAFAGRSLNKLELGGTSVVGDLSPLFALGNLGLIDLASTGLHSQLPWNISVIWPYLAILDVSGCAMFGPLPSFQNMAALGTLSLQQNSFTGPIGTDFAEGSIQLTSVSLSGNALESPLPDFCSHAAISRLLFDNNQITTLPNFTCWTTVFTLDLSNNPALQGSLPADLWMLLPKINYLALANTGLSGRIPDGPLNAPILDVFSVAHSSFSGRLPQGLVATKLDFSFNQFSGPVDLYPDGGPIAQYVHELNLESAGALSCPINLGYFYRLSTLSLASGGFDGCAFDNSSLVSLSPSITSLDISNNNWTPHFLQILPELMSLTANNASVLGLIASGPVTPLRSLSLNSNPLSIAGSPASGSLVSQLRNLLIEPNSPLVFFSCEDCNLAMPFANLLQIDAVHALSVISPPIYQTLRLSNNPLVGNLPPTLFATFHQDGELAFPVTLREISLANTSVTGRLPTLSTGSSFDQLQIINFAGTAIEGDVPASWTGFTALQQLSIQDTNLQCALLVTADDRLQCDTQAVLVASSTSIAVSTSLADPAAGVHCQSVQLRGPGAPVTLDTSYHSNTLCSCDAGSFGINGLCYLCPTGCTCSQDRIQNCFPVMQRGAVRVSSQTNPDGSRFVAASSFGAVTPFSVIALLPCPRTVTGSSLCNPDGIAWPNFYRIIESDSSTPAALMTELPFSARHFDAELTAGWCFPGHTGRLCAQCSSGYFSSGRWCLKCLSEGVHVLILTANLLMIIALIAYLYVKSPSAVSSEKPMMEYNAGIQAAAEDRSFPGLTPSASSADVAAEVGSANPLKLLIFHSQQLSLLLQTTASMPNVIAGLMSAVSSGSNGFSLASLVAMECLNTAWSMQHRCWLAIVAPIIIAAVAVATFALDRRAAGSRLNRSGRNQFSSSHREELLMADEADRDPEDAAPSVPSSAVPRIYGVCVSLLYLLVFPCAQTALSALTCTDTRQSSGGDDRVYLNLFPAQQCDSEWSRTVLPPAAIGAVFWLILFPLMSTLLLRRLRSQLHTSSLSASSSLAVWPICSDLLSPFSPRFWYWEQILLVRRLLLVSAVAIIPASSLYLPLVLFALIQLSALMQHWTNPYAHSLLNAGELISLYLLLLNYISALILSTGLVEGGFHQTADAWAVVLFLVNFTFLLVLLLGLFSLARQKLGAWVTKFVRRARQRGQRNSGGSL